MTLGGPLAASERGRHFGLVATSVWRWLPVLALAAMTAVVLSASDTAASDIGVFGAYVLFGLAVPGTLWVRLLRGSASHLAEDLTLGLCVGYCLELATYLVARALGAPLLFVLWPVVTMGGFAALPGLRGYWRGSGERAPTLWSWALVAILAFILLFSAAGFFAQHHLSGADTPYVDMPFHLALIGELRHHVPPQVPYVIGLPLAYHWFVYADAAAASWATGIEPVTLLYRLSGLPMFVAFVVLTAATARRLTGGWSSGPLAVVIALLGGVAIPYGWIDSSVFDSQTLDATWVSPTNLFGLALFSATLLVLIDLLRASAPVRRRRWILLALLVFGSSGAKGTLLPLLIVGLATVLVGVALVERRLHQRAAEALILAVVGLAMATSFIYLGASQGLIVGLEALRSFPIAASVGALRASGLSSLLVPIATAGIAVMLWSLLWSGAFGLLLRRRRSAADTSIFLLVGVCVAGLGAASIFLYPGLSELYYLRSAMGAFGLLAATGIWILLPDQGRRSPVVAAAAGCALLGAAFVVTIRALGPSQAPTLGAGQLPGILAAMILPVLALALVLLVAVVVFRRVEARVPALSGAVPLLVVALAMGFSLPSVARIIGSPFTSAGFPRGDDPERWDRSRKVAARSQRSIGTRCHEPALQVR